MGDRYRIIPRGDFCDVWLCLDDGDPIRNLGEADARVVAELNRLEQLRIESVARERLTNRTHVQHAFLREDLDRKKVEALKEHANPVDPKDGYNYFTVDVDVWNRMVRVLKALAERFPLP